jgi:hypothetical protein
MKIIQCLLTSPFFWLGAYAQEYGQTHGTVAGLITGAVAFVVVSLLQRWKPAQ